MKTWWIKLALLLCAAGMAASGCSGRTPLAPTVSPTAAPPEPTQEQTASPPTAQPETPVSDYTDPALPPAERAAALLAQMTLDEKIGQMTQVEKNSIQPQAVRDYFIGSVLSGGGGSPPENTPQSWRAMVNGFQEYALQTRLKVPIIYGVDAVHGHNNLRDAVIFPHNIGLGAANDPDLVERIGRATAEEMAATAIYWNFAPVVAVPQDIRWGRTYEGYGEDTGLVSRLGTAYLRGLQGDDLSAPDSVLATPKHFVGDGGTAWGSATTNNYPIDQGVTDVDEETLRRVHLPPYEEAVANGARSIMVSFSSWEGQRMSANRYLLTDVLKGEMGFTGFIVSDWGSIDMIDRDYYKAVVASINAGVDMNMVPYDYARFISTLKAAVERGDVPLERIDDAVLRILTVKFEMGLFEDPYGERSDPSLVGTEAHRELAREAVAKSLVLLKNDQQTLPIPKDIPHILVAGVGADDIGIQSGGWTIDWQGRTGDITAGTTVYEGILEHLSPDIEVVFNRFARFEDQEVAGRPPIGIVVVGENPYAEGVGDSNDLAIKTGDLAVIQRMRERVDRLVVVLISGRPMIVTDLLPEIDALVAAWLPGSEGGGVADVLFGDQPFTGRLAYAWPRSMDQLPLDRSSPGEGCAGPLFPFGYGLSYDSAVEVPELELICP